MSSGQIRVREIIAEYLPTYQKLKEEPCYPYLPNKLLYEIRGRFGEDITIRDDSITGQELTNPSISKNYLNWLYSSKSAQRIEKNFPKVNLDRFIYDDGEGEVAYLGGIKYDSTFACLFGIANGSHIPKHDWNSVYFPFEGILKTGDGGYHRLLAHVLYGNTEIYPESMYIYDDQSASDETLHSSLLKLERCFAEIGQSFYVDWNQYSRHEKIPRQEQALLVKEIASNLTFEEQSIIKKFYLYCIQKRHYEFDCYLEDDTFTLRSLIKILDEIKLIQAKPRLNKIISKISSRYELYDFLPGLFRRQSSPLEKWLLEE